MRLRLRIQAGGRLIQEQPLGFDQQCAGERHALLFSARQHLRPVPILIQVRDKPRQPGIDQRLSYVGFAGMLPEPSDRR